MHKVSRSLLFASIVALGGLAACGDDVTVAGPGTGTGTVIVSPNPAEIAVNGTVNMVADRSGAAAGQTVAWTSSNTAIATVDAASGVVTGKSNGTVAVTATTTGGFSGSATVKVGSGEGGTASVTIASITTGNLQTPVNTNAVAGQIDVTLNIDAAGQALSKVELVVKDSASGAEAVCATQTISAASLAAKAEGVSASIAAGANESVAAASTVTLSCNTAAVAANGAVNFTNGPKTISARVYDGAGALINTAANSVRVNFANVSGFVVKLENTPSTPAALRTAEGTAVSTVDGLLYQQGGVKVTLTGVNYTAGQTASFASVGGSLTQIPPVGTTVPNAGPATVALTFAPVAGTQNFTATASATALAGAQGLYAVAIGGSTTTGGSVGPTAVSGGVNQIRVDNVAPVSTGAFAAALVNPFYVNGTYSFAAANTALFTAPTAPADAAVGGTKVRFFAGTPAQITALSLTAPDFAPLKEITTGEQLDATLVNSAYRVAAVTSDALGNFVVQKLTPTFGVDKVAPTGFAFVATTPADSSINPTAVYDFVEADFADNASGFGLAPLFVNITRTTGTTAATKDICVAPMTTGTAGACVIVPQAPTFTFDASAAAEGYYNMSTTLSDTAGNRTAPLVRQFLVDNTDPTVAGGIAIPATIAAGTSVAFSQNLTDNLDLGAATLSILYPALPAGINGIRADSVQLGTYGADVLTKTASPTLTVSSFIRSFAWAPGGVPSATNNVADAVRINAIDVAGNMAQTPQALPAANITGSNTDWTTLGITSFAVTNVATNIKNGTAAPTTPPTPETVDLTAEVLASSLSVNNPFDSVVFWYVEPTTGELVQIGTATVSVMTNAANERIFRYTLAGWNPPAALGTAVTANIVATGLKGGNALGTDINTNITLVP